MMPWLWELAFANYVLAVAICAPELRFGDGQESFRMAPRLFSRTLPHFALVALPNSALMMARNNTENIIAIINAEFELRRG